MEFSAEMEYAHASQSSIVRIDLVIEGVKRRYVRGDRYHIPANVRHSGRIFAGYTDITFFDQQDRYAAKPSNPPGP